MAKCDVCKRDFPTRTGLAVHGVRAKNPECRIHSFHPNLRQKKKGAESSNSDSSAAASLEPSENEDDDEDEDGDNDMDLEEDHPPQIFQGDFFGNHYSADELPGWGDADADQQEAEAEDEPAGSLSDDEDDLQEAVEANEIRWEPERPAPMESADRQPEDTEETSRAPVVDALKQRRMEAALNRQIHVTKFPSNVAGMPIDSATRNHASYQQYATMLGGAPDGDGVNYAPFASKIDWDLARWAKMRGPGSSAISELLAIDGVR